jgi:hypothetical protein
MDSTDAPAGETAARLEEIAIHVGDAWLRCRGPLTGLKALIEAQAEAVRLGAAPEYLDRMGEIVRAARVLEGKSPTRHFGDARNVLEREIPRLREAAHVQAHA